MTEREKQMQCVAYDGADPELKAMQARAQKLTRRLNAHDPCDTGGFRRIETALFGRVGKNLRVCPPLHVDFGVNIELGDDVFINQNCTLLDNNRITIGDRTLIAPDVRIYCGDHPIQSEKRHAITADGGLSIVSSSRPVVIGSDVWIGGNAVLLPGITVGNRSVVGAGSVVTKDVPPDVVVAGNPAKIAKQLDVKGANQ